MRPHIFRDGGSRTPKEDGLLFSPEQTLETLGLNLGLPGLLGFPSAWQDKYIYSTKGVPT